MSKHTVSMRAAVLILSGSKKSIFLCLKRSIPAPMAHTSTAGMTFLERHEKFTLSSIAGITCLERSGKFTLFSDHNRSLLRRQPGAMPCFGYEAWEASDVTCDFSGRMWSSWMPARLAPSVIEQDLLAFWMILKLKNRFSRYYLGSPVSHLASHSIDAERRSLFFVLSSLFEPGTGL